MMKKLNLTAILILACAAAALAQLSLPRESQRQTVSQTVGDATVSVVYHRPNVKARKIWGELVPYGQVWRAGANENTTFEVSRDVTINGQALPAGKYGFHAIPNKDEWVIIFSKVNDAWGSFTYDEKQDALRVKVKPVKAEFRESLAYDFGTMTANSAQIAIVWENLAIPFTVDAGDVSGRTLAQIRDAIKNRKADDARPYNQGASYVLTFKQKNNYGEAIGWVDESIKMRETFGNLGLKARLLAESGKTQEAIAAGEKAVQIGKAATPPVDTAEFEKTLNEWKARK